MLDFAKSNATQPLIEKLNAVLLLQGFEIGENGISPNVSDRESKRKLHAVAKAERTQRHRSFLSNNLELVKKHSLDSTDLDVSKISPRLIEVKSGSKYEILFKWWNMVWWSLPYERAYGRQMRFIVWDEYHQAPIGLIGLQSPILSWSVRDQFLNIPSKTRDIWVNQSMSAQRLGALPPYNNFLGGKLVAMLMTSNEVRKAFEKKYKGTKTLMKKRHIPARLLFITTTGAFGKSSVYNRLRFNKETVAKFIGFTSGNGSFHIPNSLYIELISYLEKLGRDVSRGYGNGPSRKMRLIDEALTNLGIQNGTNHGVKRAVYYFPMAQNVHDVISKQSDPSWYDRDVEELTEFWKKRWILPRANRIRRTTDFKFKAFLDETIKEIESATLFDAENMEVDYDSTQ